MIVLRMVMCRMIVLRVGVRRVSRSWRNRKRVLAAEDGSGGNWGKGLGRLRFMRGDKYRLRIRVGGQLQWRAALHNPVLPRVLQDMQVAVAVAVADCADPVFAKQALFEKRQEFTFAALIDQKPC